MSRVSRLIFTSLLLATLASCHRENNAGLPGNTDNPQANTASNPTKLSDDEYALITAAADGDTKKVKEMLDKGVNVNTRADFDGDVTPLGLTAWFGHIDTAKFLIEKGADVNAKKRDGSSVLMLATMTNHTELADILRKAGAK